MYYPDIFFYSKENEYQRNKIPVSGVEQKIWALRLLSGVANLASKFECSKPFSFRDTTSAYDFFKIYKEIRYKNLVNVEILNPVFGCCHGSCRGCKTFP